MLIAKLIMCLYAIGVLILTTGCNVINGDSSKDHNDAATTTAPEVAGNEKIDRTVKTADLTGLPANTFQIFSYSGSDGEWRSESAVYQIQIDGPGTFVILSAGIDSSTCSGDQVQATYALFDTNADGSLVSMRPVTTQQPLVFYEQKLLHLQVDATVKAHCTSAGPSTFFLSMKYIKHNSGEYPIIVPDPDHPVKPDPTPVPGPRPLPIPIASCDNATIPADAPKSYQAKINLWTAPSAAEGCKKTFSWVMKDVVRPDPLNNCVFPEIKAEAPQDQFLKISETFSTHNMQLAWLLLQSVQEADLLKTKIMNGETVDLTYDGDSCLDAAGTGDVPQKLTKLTQPTDLLLFRNDNRDIDDCGSVMFSAMEPKTGTDNHKEVQATYDYSENTPEKFFYKLTFDFSVPNSGTPVKDWKTAFYNRKSHAWITEWQNVPGNSSFQNSVIVKDPASLRRLLPNQEHLELVFRRPAAACDKNALPVQAVFDVGNLFTSSAADAYFKDLKNPTRSRFLLSESDLPF